MSQHWLWFRFQRKFLKRSLARKLSSNNHGENGIHKIRNIGVLAHIDAGKTTTTERMLYYSGTIRSMGEVHHGNTVTDYMEQERQRGITITSAAVSFPWREHQINLIDTPGHIDFTMEVEQSLGVLDGAIIILDASAGVEAQTQTVWRQTEGYRLPRLLYLNKMDRGDASAERCLRSLRDKLEVTPLLLHRDVRRDDKLVGLIDFVSIDEIVWGLNRGQKYTRRKLTEATDGKAWAETMEARRELVDTISSLDDNLADTVIQMDSLDNVNPSDISEAIKRVTIDRKAYPVLCGSSYKNIGVQTLMDAVVDYLPSPVHCNKLYRCFEQELSARAFKVQHDDQKGVLTYFRIFSGEITKGQKMYNLGQEKSEQSGPLYVAYADEYKNVNNVTAGNIAVVSGLKATMTGDLVTSTQSAATRAKANLLRLVSQSATVPEELTLPSARQRLGSLDSVPEKEQLVDILLGIGTRVPAPVFVCSVEPPSAAYASALDVALAELQREDPSLRVSYDEDTGQVVLAGMGELHLEIIKERIVREYKIEVELGPLQIAYRETLLTSARCSHTVDRKVGAAKQFVKLTMSANHVKDIAEDKILKLDKSQDSASNLAHVLPRQLTAIRQGVTSALLHGPRLGCPMVDVGVTLHWLEVGRGTADTSLAAAVTQCLRKAFEEAEAVLLEPIMALEVVCPEGYTSRVLSDLTRRRADIQGIDVRGHNKVIQCLAPLSELLGYSSALRSLSSGGATFTMEFHTNRQMSPHDEQNAIRSVMGF